MMWSKSVKWLKTNSRHLKTLIHNFKSHSVFYVQKCAFYKCNIIIICLWRKQEVMMKVKRHAWTHAEPITTLLHSGFLVSLNNRRSEAKVPLPRQQANPQYWSVGSKWGKSAKVINRWWLCYNKWIKHVSSWLRPHLPVLKSNLLSIRLTPPQKLFMTHQEAASHDVIKSTPLKSMRSQHLGEDQTRFKYGNRKLYKRSHGGYIISRHGGALWTRWPSEANSIINRVSGAISWKVTKTQRRVYQKLSRENKETKEKCSFVLVSSQSAVLPLSGCGRRLPLGALSDPPLPFVHDLSCRGRGCSERCHSLRRRHHPHFQRKTHQTAAASHKHNNLKDSGEGYTHHHNRSQNTQGWFRSETVDLMLHLCPDKTETYTLKIFFPDVRCPQCHWTTPLFSQSSSSSAWSLGFVLPVTGDITGVRHHTKPKCRARMTSWSLHQHSLSMFYNYTMIA